jgi:acetyl-CoA carboxylase carboxyl transferase subunit alpha
MANRLKSVLTQELASLKKMHLDNLIELRYQKFMAMGASD